MKKYLLIILILSLIALWPFFKNGFFESHDGEWMIIRFTAFHQTLKAGQLPVRFVDRLNNNYGYPVLNFLYPLPFYLAEIPKILGFNFINSIKIVFVASSLVSVFAMFWALSQLFSVESAFAGSVIYLFLPYRFVDLYVRGSLGENLAFALIPLILGSIFKIVKGNIFFHPILSVFAALLILSHNVIAILFVPFFLILSLFIAKMESKKIFLSFFTGILISAFFWLPALYDLKFVRQSQIKVSNISDHLVPVSKLILPSWGYSPNPNSSDGFSTQLGLVTIAVFIGLLFILQKEKKKQLLYFLVFIFLSVSFLLTKFSLPFWNLPFVDIIQFPWRMLSLLVFLTAFSSAFLIQSLKKRTLASLIIVLAAVLSTIAYTKPSVFVSRPDSYYSTNEDSTTVKDEYLPLWVKEKPPHRSNKKIEIQKGHAVIESEIIKSANYKAKIIASEDSEIKINTIYFPGWQSKVDDKKVLINYDNPQGLITFLLPEGNHNVIINYTKTPVHLTAELISLIAGLTICISFYKTWRKHDS